MAVIWVDRQTIWHDPSWLYEFILNRIKFLASHLHITQHIERALMPGYNAMYLVELTPEDREVFRLQVAGLLDILPLTGPGAVTSRQVFDQMVRLISRLEQMLRSTCQLDEVLALNATPMRS